MKKIKNRLLLFFFFLISTTLFLTPSIAVAFDTAPPPNWNPQITCDSDTGINTAIGCIPIHNREAFLTFLLTWAIGIAGGIGIISIVFGGYSIMTSSGNPDKIQAGKELITASIAGILLLIFSTFLLKVLGVDIFGIPNF